MTWITYKISTLYLYIHAHAWMHACHSELILTMKVLAMSGIWQYWETNIWGCWLVHGTHWSELIKKCVVKQLIEISGIKWLLPGMLYIHMEDWRQAFIALTFTWKSWCEISYTHCMDQGSMSTVPQVVV